MILRNLMAGKPVSRILFGARAVGPRAVAIIPLGPDSHLDSSSLPEGPNEPGRLSPPIWPCTTRGLPCHPDCSGRGGLLPHRFTLTVPLTFTAHSREPPSDLLKVSLQPGHRGELLRRFIFCGTFRSRVFALHLCHKDQPPGVTRRIAL